MSENKYCKIIKIRPGHLRITLVNPMTQARQTLVFTADKKEQILPIEWAALIFADTASGAYKMLKSGYYTVDDIEIVKKYAMDNGLMMGSVDFTPREANYTDKILVALKSGSKAAVKPFLTPEHQEYVARVARENIATLSNGMINYLEDTLKIRLTVENEDLATN